MAVTQEEQSDIQVRKILGPDAYKLLHGEDEIIRERTTAREAFNDAITQFVGERLQQPTFVNKKAPPFDILDALAKEQGIAHLKELYVAAIREERNSRDYKNAVFLKSIEVYQGGDFEQQRVILIAGPSGVGKSSVRAELVNAITKGTLTNVNPENIDERSHHLVVSVDGGIEREVSKVRDRMNKAAIKLGYAGIENLEEVTLNATKGTPKLKINIENAADAAMLHLMIPTTHPAKDLDNHMGPDSTKEVSYVNVHGKRSIVRKLSRERSFAKLGTRFDSIDNMTRVPESKKPGKRLSFELGTRRARAGEQEYAKRQRERGKEPVVFEVKKDLMFAKLIKNQHGEPIRWERCKANDPAGKLMTERQFQGWEKVQKSPELQKQYKYIDTWIEDSKNKTKNLKIAHALTSALIKQKPIPNTYEFSARSSDIPTLQTPTALQDGYEDIRIALSSVVFSKESNQQLLKDLKRSTTYNQFKKGQEGQEKLLKTFSENPKANGLHQGLWADVTKTMVKNFEIKTPKGVPCPHLFPDLTTIKQEYFEENGIYTHSYDTYIFPTANDANDIEKTNDRLQRIRELRLAIRNNQATSLQQKELAELYKHAIHLKASVSIDTNNPPDKPSEANINIQITPGALIAKHFTYKFPQNDIPGISTPKQPTSLLSTARKWLSKKTPKETPEEPISRTFPPNGHAAHTEKSINKITPQGALFLTDAEVKNIEVQIEGLAKLETAPLEKNPTKRQLLSIEGRDPIAAVKKCPQLQATSYILEIPKMEKAEEYAQELLSKCDKTTNITGVTINGAKIDDATFRSWLPEVARQKSAPENLHTLFK